MIVFYYKLKFSLSKYLKINLKMYNCKHNYPSHATLCNKITVYHYILLSIKENKI